MSGPPRRRIALHAHQRHLLTHLPSAQTGIFRGASRQRASTIADDPPGRLRSTGGVDRGAAATRARSASGLPASRFRQSQRGYDSRHGGGNSGVTAKLIGRSSFQESSRLWQTSQGRGPNAASKSSSGGIRNYGSYFGNLQQTPELDHSGYKATDKLVVMKPYDETKKSMFGGSGSQRAPGTRIEMDHMYSRSSKIPRGQSYLFKHSQNPAVTGKPVGSAVSVSRNQQVGPAETQTPAHPTTGMEGKHAASSQRSGTSSPLSGSMHVSKPAQSPQRLYGFTGFEHPRRSRPKDNSGQHGFNKGRFKMSNVFPALSAKYSFSQRDPERLGGVQREYAWTTARPFTLGSKETRLQVPEWINGRKPDRRTFNTHGISTLRGFDASTLGGAKPSIHRSDKPVKVQPGFQGFYFRNSQIWRPERTQMHRWYNRSGAGGGGITATGELTGEDLKMDSRTNVSVEAKAGMIPDISRKNRKIFTFLRIPLNQTHQDFQEYDPATIPVNSRISPANLATTRSQTGSGPSSKSHRSKLRDATNAIDSRPPKQPARLESFTYTDVLGNASFSSVGASVQSHDPANRKVM